MSLINVSQWPELLPPGTRVRKIGGNYQATGEIVASWIELDGKPRYVFRFDEPRGLLHIFTAAQVEPEMTNDTGVPLGKGQGYF